MITNCRYCQRNSSDIYVCELGLECADDCSFNDNNDLPCDGCEGLDGDCKMCF